MLITIFKTRFDDIRCASVPFLINFKSTLSESALGIWKRGCKITERWNMTRKSRKFLLQSLNFTTLLSSCLSNFGGVKCTLLKFRGGATPLHPLLTHPLFSMIFLYQILCYHPSSNFLNREIASLRSKTKKK